MLCRFSIQFILFIIRYSIVLPPAVVFAQSATIRIDSLLFLLKKDKEDTNKIIHLNKLCGEYQHTGRYDTASYYGNAALQLAQKLNFLKGMSTAYNNIGIVYDIQGNYAQALENYFAALKIRKETDDKQGIAASYNNIGVIYDNQGNYDKALENYFTALKIREETGDKTGTADSYNNIGIVYYNQASADNSGARQIFAMLLF